MPTRSRQRARSGDRGGARHELWLYFEDWLYDTMGLFIDWRGDYGYRIDWFFVCFAIVCTAINVLLFLRRK